MIRRYNHKDLPKEMEECVDGYWVTFEDYNLSELTHNKEIVPELGIAVIVVDVGAATPDVVVNVPCTPYAVPYGFCILTL